MTLYQQTYDILDDHFYNTLGKNVPEIIEIIMGYVIRGGHPLYGVNQLEYMRILYSRNHAFILASTSYLSRNIPCRSQKKKILTIMFRAKSTALYECKEMIPQTLKLCDTVKNGGIRYNYGRYDTYMGDIVALKSSWDTEEAPGRHPMWSIKSHFEEKARSRIVKFPEHILKMREMKDKSEIIKMIEQFEKTKFAKSWTKAKLVKYYYTLE